MCKPLNTILDEWFLNFDLLSFVYRSFIMEPTRMQARPQLDLEQVCKPSTPQVSVMMAFLSSLPVMQFIVIASEANCFGLGLGPPVCNSGVMTVNSPVGPGFTLVTYVETQNTSVSSGPATLRREWFLGKFSNESTIVPG